MKKPRPRDSEETAESSGNSHWARRDERRKAERVVEIPPSNPHSFLRRFSGTLHRKTGDVVVETVYIQHLKVLETRRP